MCRGKGRIERIYFSNQPLEKSRPKKISPIPNRKISILPIISTEFPPNSEKIMQKTPHNTAIADPLMIEVLLMTHPIEFNQILFSYS